MSSIETAVLGSRKIETLLRDHFKAEGKGLHERLTSVERRIPLHILKQARYVASIRNRVVHECEEIDDINSFNQTIESVLSGLYEAIEQERFLAEQAKRAVEQERLRDEKQRELAARFKLEADIEAERKRQLLIKNPPSNTINIHHYISGALIIVLSVSILAILVLYVELK